VVVATIDITRAKKDLSFIIDDIQTSHEPLVIAGKNNSAVLISEEDWRDIEETLHLTSLPALKKSIDAGVNELLSECKPLSAVWPDV
jgi:PHD/YefM family antitoxin component YafN of YafNO toxin-antitoxin module